MKGITKKQVEELAAMALAKGNPYMAAAVKFFIGGEARYIYADKVHTAAELDEAYLETARKDARNGYNERGVGYYDKWYRYTRADGGRAYDLGVRLAADTNGCPDEFNIIPCMH